MNDNNNNVKALVTKLAANNENQREWVWSVRVAAGQLSANQFLSRAYSRTRIAVRADLIGEAVKLETKADSDGDDTAATAAKKSKSTSSGDDPGSSPTTPIVVYDEDLGLDDLEAAILGNLPVFLATDSLTRQELASDTVKRMKLFRQLVMATPHHNHKTRNCPEGDCYGFLKLVLKHTTVTGQTQYKSMMDLGKIKFGGSTTITELVTSLRDVQDIANRHKADCIDEDIMKCALLSLAQGHKNFERLATDFSKKSVSLSFDNIVDEFLTHEANLEDKAGPAPSQ